MPSVTKVNRTLAPWAGSRPLAWRPSGISTPAAVATTMPIDSSFVSNGRKRSA